MLVHGRLRRIVKDRNLFGNVETGLEMLLIRFVIGLLLSLLGSLRLLRKSKGDFCLIGQSIP